jgi:anti-sigma B factor antagonist
MITQVNTRHIEPDITVIELHGELHAGNTLLSAESTIKRVIADRTKKIILDLSGVRTIDSSGVGMLVVASALAKQNGGQLRAAGASGSVSTTLDLVQIGQVLASDPDVETACKNFA